MKHLHDDKVYTKLSFLFTLDEFPIQEKRLFILSKMSAFILFKGLLVIFKAILHVKMAMSDSQWYSGNPLSDK